MEERDYYIKMAGYLTKSNNESFTDEEKDRFWDDFIDLIESKGIGFFWEL